MPLTKPERWRRYFKVAVASVIAGACRLDQPPKIRDHRRPFIAGYHRVVEDFDSASKTEMPGMLISRAMFERHVDRIGRSFRFVGLDEIGERARSGRPFLEPVAAVTFDDGYRDVYEHAFPVLRRKGIPAGVFVVTDLVGRPIWQTHDRLYCLVEKAYATWEHPRQRLLELMTALGLAADPVLQATAAFGSPAGAVSALLPVLPQAEVIRLMDGLEAHVGPDPARMSPSLTWHMIREMQRHGITIGSHTRRHVSLPSEPPLSLKEELEGSKRALETELGERIDHFAYPGGHFTSEVVAALDDAGYRYAYTSCRHVDPGHPALTLERQLLWEGSSLDARGRFSPAVFSCQIHARWPFARRCDRPHDGGRVSAGSGLAAARPPAWLPPEASQPPALAPDTSSRGVRRL
jgi:peptidoglycan/xylan/chitin deacetylase (PgdA/CDA1 family)